MHIDNFKKIVIKIGSSILIDDKGKPKTIDKVVIATQHENMLQRFGDEKSEFNSDWKHIHKLPELF